MLLFIVPFETRANANMYHAIGVGMFLYYLLINAIKPYMKTMISMRVDTKLNITLSRIATERNRTFSNLVETVLLKHVESKKQKSTRKFPLNG